MNICLGDTLIELIHGVDARALTVYVWMNIFYGEKIYCSLVILTVEGVGFLEGPQLALHVYGQCL